MTSTTVFLGFEMKISGFPMWVQSTRVCVYVRFRFPSPMIKQEPELSTNSGSRELPPYEVGEITRWSNRRTDKRLGRRTSHPAPEGRDHPPASRRSCKDSSKPPFFESCKTRYTLGSHLSRIFSDFFPRSPIHARAFARDFFYDFRYDF